MTSSGFLPSRRITLSIRLPEAAGREARAGRPTIGVSGARCGFCVRARHSEDASLAPRPIAMAANKIAPRPASADAHTCGSGILSAANGVETTASISSPITPPRPADMFHDFGIGHSARQHAAKRMAARPHIQAAGSCCPMPKARRTPPIISAKPSRMAVQPKPCMSMSPNTAPTLPNMFSGPASRMALVTGSCVRETAMLSDGSAELYDEHAPQMNTPPENAIRPLRKRVRALEPCAS